MVYLDVTLCYPVDRHQHFGETHFLHVVTELSWLRKKQCVISERETYRPGATLPFFIFFFPHSLLLVLLLSIPMKNKLFRVMIQMTCSQPPSSTTHSDCYAQITPLFPCKKAGLNTRKAFCIFDLHIRKKLVKWYIWSIALYGTAIRTLWKVDQNTWKILKCGTEDEHSRSVGLIIRTKKYYVYWSRKGTSYIPQTKEG